MGNVTTSSGSREPDVTNERQRTHVRYAVSTSRSPSPERHSSTILMAPMHNVKPPNFDGTEDVMQFLSTFEEVKQVNQWDLKTAAIHLKLAVTGAAPEGMRGDDYQQLKQSLEKRYQLSKEDARLQLKHANRRKGKDIFAYGERMRKLVCQANPDLKDGAADEATIAEVLDTLGDRTLRRELKALGKIEFQDAIKLIGEYLTEMEKEKKDLLAIRKVAVEEVPNVSSSLAEVVKQMEA